ncbi:glycoside hydrolase family 5 protein [Polyangium mundeleinium]|uniref:Glycoside hydrolase family 5 protein n=1 Tax=Polyangium mundeleinium TaxID=2995306 RepID=A0ABT5EJ82_9BACT|nr:glycoside hydrolase family 5 protein [Polyangium mundeleinium]MDC0740801.1 glycoside hydrolase family 5 protein [Polyangium mundeleinium]
MSSEWLCAVLGGLLLATAAGCAAGHAGQDPSGGGSDNAGGAGGAGGGGHGGGGSGGGGGSPGHALPPLPLHTEGRWILDASGERFKFAAVNWYGAEEMDYVPAGLEIAELGAIAARIRALGFNAVRLPWSNEMVDLNPVVADKVVSANPKLKGKTALEVFDAVIDALAHEGLVVILDNHVSEADWCCSDTDQNGLWYTSKYPEATWLKHWEALAKRYAAQPAVVAADLRNEPRPVLEAGCQACTQCPCGSCGCVTPVWGGGDPATDWHGAATRGGNTVLKENPNLLIVVEGLNYGSDLGGPYTLPVTLDVPGRVVYSAHDYAWFHTGLSDYQQLKTELGNKWGYILTQGQPFTAPVLVGEFGTCHSGATCVSDATGQGFWFSAFRTYLSEADIDWAYWAVNGTQARGTGRVFGAEETYGILDTKWEAPASEPLLSSLQALQAVTQKP